MRERKKRKGKGSSRAIYFARIAQNRRRKGGEKEEEQTVANIPFHFPPCTRKGEGGRERRPRPKPA